MGYYRCQLKPVVDYMVPAELIEVDDRHLHFVYMKLSLHYSNGTCQAITVVKLHTYIEIHKINSTNDLKLYSKS
jgi:hypothetical protein